jgi:hypothetical protein
MEILTDEQIEELFENDPKRDERPTDEELERWFVDITRMPALVPWHSAARAK